LLASQVTGYFRTGGLLAALEENKRRRARREEEKRRAVERRGETREKRRGAVKREEGARIVEPIRLGPRPHGCPSCPLQNQSRAAISLRCLENSERTGKIR
jgi:hypothetical protein